MVRVAAKFTRAEPDIKERKKCRAYGEGEGAGWKTGFFSFFVRLL